jgi:hypothetical protein
MYADHLLQPWLDCLLERLPAATVFDACLVQGRRPADRDRPVSSASDE